MRRDRVTELKEFMECQLAKQHKSTEMLTSVESFSPFQTCWSFFLYLFSVQFGCVLQSALCLDIHQNYPDLFFRKTKKKKKKLHK